jgi:hypothetical protein
MYYAAADALSQSDFGLIQNNNTNWMTSQNAGVITPHKKRVLQTPPNTKTK